MNREMQYFRLDEIGPIRVIFVEDEPYFVGTDVTQALGYVKPNNPLDRHVDPLEKRLESVKSPGGPQKMIVLTLTGLHALLFKCKLKSSKRVKTWIRSVVIPSVTPINHKTPNELPESIKKIVDRVDFMYARMSQTFTAQTVTNIAKKYNLSAVALNKLLEEEGVQSKVDDEWVLDSRLHQKGYIRIEYETVHLKSGHVKRVQNRKWTKKGQLFIDQLMISKGLAAGLVEDRHAKH